MIKFNYLNGNQNLFYPITVDDKEYYYFPNFSPAGLTDKKTLKFTQSQNRASDWNLTVNGTQYKTEPLDDYSFTDPMGIFETFKEYSAYFPPSTMIDGKRYYMMNSFLHAPTDYIVPRRNIDGTLYNITHAEGTLHTPGSFSLDTTNFIPKFQLFVPEELKTELFSVGLTTDIEDLEEFYRTKCFKWIVEQFKKYSY